MRLTHTALPVALLVLVAAVYYGPEHLAAATRSSHAAMAYVAAGAESAALWALLAGMLWRTPAAAPCVWGLVEAVQRPLCRLMLPMDAPPKLAPSQTMCDAATGLPVSWLGFALAGLVVAAFAGGAHVHRQSR